MVIQKVCREGGAEGSRHRRFMAGYGESALETGDTQVSGVSHVERQRGFGILGQRKGMPSWEDDTVQMHNK